MISDAFDGYNTIARWNLKKALEDFVGKSIDFSIRYNNGSLDFDILKNDPLIYEIRSSWVRMMRSVKQDINNTSFRRMNAERNVIPESSSTELLSASGAGASNLIRKIISESEYDESLIEDKLLAELNNIIKPDGEFESIRIQQISYDNNGIWEVFLKEKGRTRIPLSQMGSGIKTIIIVLLNLLVIPELYKNKKYVFAFEEIENNLHPALQRRVFDYLYSFATDNDVCIYLTTHSHVAINCFYDKEHASIYHIEKNGITASVKKIESYLDKAELLSDLDVKASDILQSNGIIWVEGPSDRIYIKRWLEIFTDNKFVEGKHFQFLYYGGRVLSHYSLEKTDDLICILTTNRNAAIVIDSDKKNKQASINETKKRIVSEFDDLNMFSWVTKGKEIENYIPVEAIREMVGNHKIRSCNQYTPFNRYIDKFYNGFESKKVVFANEIVPFMKIDYCQRVLDLQKKILDLYSYIEKWNQ